MLHSVPENWACTLLKHCIQHFRDSYITASVTREGLTLVFSGPDVTNLGKSLGERGLEGYTLTNPSDPHKDLKHLRMYMNGWRGVGGGGVGV